MMMVGGLQLAERTGRIVRSAGIGTQNHRSQVGERPFAHPRRRQIRLGKSAGPLFQTPRLVLPTGNVARPVMPQIVDAGGDHQQDGLFLRKTRLRQTGKRPVRDDQANRVIKDFTEMGGVMVRQCMWDFTQNAGHQ